MILSGFINMNEEVPLAASSLTLQSQQSRECASIMQNVGHVKPRSLVVTCSKFKLTG